MGTCRVIIEPEPQSGVRNMAIDEALLEAAVDRNQCTVRWYRWLQATVSLGYFQDGSAAAALSALAALPAVRRLTGGGAILHHHEWTYSCAVPSAHPLAKSPSRIYELVHDCIIAALAGHGVRSAALRGPTLSSDEGAFLCFERGDPRDIVLKHHKIVGSAQRRRRGAVLQHGSLLVRRSEFAPQLPGIHDLESVAPFDEPFIAALGESIGSLFGVPSLSREHDHPIENDAARAEARYRTLDWPRRH